jgi:hypothetical protein
MSTNAISGLGKTLKKFPANWEATSAAFRAVLATTKPASRKTVNKAADLVDTDVVVATKAVPASKARKAA